MTKKFENFIKRIIAGDIPRGYNLSLLDIRELYSIYTEIKKGNKPEFINSKVKNTLDKFNIKIVECGIGWKIK